MKTKIDWSKYEFRASQCSKLLTGNIPTANEFDARIKELEYERDNLINKNKRKVFRTQIPIHRYTTRTICESLSRYHGITNHKKPLHRVP